MKTGKWEPPSNVLDWGARLNVTFLLSFILFLSSCAGQTKKDEKVPLSQAESESTVLMDSLDKPQINVRVNKQYDKDGNLITFDSTYSYVYKRGSGTGTPLSNDSIFNNFKSYFNIHSPGMFDRQTDNIFFNDSLFKYDFFNDDYFQKRFELNQRLFENFYKQMDSLKGNYLRQTYSEKNLNRTH